MSKNIVIFSDGTGKEGGEGANTNIYKLFNMIEDRTSRQVSFYDPGLGTGWRKITGNVGGAGISKNIKQCYSFIYEHYTAGDQIFLFGFSRGATTVRSLSSFIHYFGMLPRSRPELVDEAYKIYKIRDKDKRKRRAQEFVSRHHTMWTKIKFLGCFDTVAALGVPFKPASVLIDYMPGLKHQFHDLRLSESVLNAYHALAIDDERLTFHPKLWDVRDNQEQSIKQVWFCGMHTDVGGGYDIQQLSDIPLEWMRDMATNHGLHIYKNHGIKINGDVNGHMHNSRGNFLTGFYREKKRFWPSDRTDKPTIHESVLNRKKSAQNKDTPPYKPWILELNHDIEPLVQQDEH